MVETLMTDLCPINMYALQALQRVTQPVHQCISTCAAHVSDLLKENSMLGKFYFFIIFLFAARDRDSDIKRARHAHILIMI